ncbi:GntR family transcriptional regulator [Streptomyces sp. NBC_01356]
MSQQASPRGTFLKIADAVKAQIDSDPAMTQLPSAAEIMSAHGVSRGVALRVFDVLQKDGLAEPVPGARWRVVRSDSRTDRRPLVDRIADVITDDRLEVGAAFLSASELCARFGVSRPTVRRALDKLEAAGLLTEGGQGKLRTVRALPNR